MIPKSAIELAISAKTPSGAKRRIFSIIFIKVSLTVSKRSIIGFCFSSDTLDKHSPKNSEKKIICKIFPSINDLKGLSGIILIIVPQKSNPEFAPA